MLSTGFCHIRAVIHNKNSFMRLGEDFHFLLGPAPAVLQQSRASSAPRPGPAAGPLRGGGVGPTGRPREGRARAPAAGRPPCPSARFLGGRRRLGGERGARLRPPRPAPAGVGEAAAAPPAPPTPEAARPPRGHLRR